MGRGVRDDPLTDDEMESWWIRVRQKHAEANATWQAEVERKLKDARGTKEGRGAYDLAAEQKTGQNKEKKPIGHHKEAAATTTLMATTLTAMPATAPKPFKPIKAGKAKKTKTSKASKGKKSNGPGLF